VRAVGAGGAAGEDRDTGFRVSPYAQSFSPGARLILNCLSWMAHSPPLDVSNHICELFRSHRRGGIFERPTQSEDISRETARGVAAPALEHLHEPWQVDAGDGAEQHVDVGPENGQRHDVSVFSRSGSAKVLTQEDAGGRVDHRTAVARRPRDVDVELVGGHFVPGVVESAQRCSRAEAWARPALS